MYYLCILIVGHPTNISKQKTHHGTNIKITLDLRKCDSKELYVTGTSWRDISKADYTLKINYAASELIAHSAALPHLNLKKRRFQNMDLLDFLEIVISFTKIAI